MEHQPTDLVPPPPYSDLTDEPPLYETTIQPATLKFPASLNGYFQWKFTTTFHLGPSAEEKLYAVSTESSLFRSKQALTLHDGPTEKHPPLASAESMRYTREKPFTISIPPLPGSSSATPTTQTVDNISTVKRSTYTFTFPIPPPTSRNTSTTARKTTSHLETFEWRRSYGKEVQDLATHSYGWKLVRLSNRVRSSSTSRSRRGRGHTSDGKEVVAVVAHNSSWSMTKGVKFAFLGSGLTGALGEEWEVMVLMSGLQLWGMDYQDQALAAGAAA